MSKIKFHTMFDVAANRNSHKIYDRRDNVDRVSYVDNTLMVTRFINEGRNLMEARAKALRAGAYTGDMKEIENDKGIACPVYDIDPVIVKDILNGVTFEGVQTPSNNLKSDTVVEEKLSTIESPVD